MRPIEATMDGQQQRWSHSILLVEDDDDFRLGLAEFLRGEGYLVTCAANGLEALSYLKSAPQPPSVVLLDLKMPVMSGWDFRAKMLEDSAFASIPVIVLSGAVTPADVATLRAAATLNKPVDFERLVSMLEGTLLDACSVCGQWVGEGRKTVTAHGSLAAVLCKNCEEYTDSLTSDLNELALKLRRTHARDRTSN